MSDIGALLAKAEAHVAFINREIQKWWDDEHCIDNGQSARIIGKLIEALRAATIADSEIVSTAQVAARLSADAELIIAADPTTYTDRGFRAAMRRIVQAAENALSDDRFITGPQPVVDPTPEDEAGRVGPTMPQEGQR